MHRTVRAYDLCDGGEDGPHACPEANDVTCIPCGHVFEVEDTNCIPKCPNCGAPLDVDLAGMCRYCKAPVMSGEYGWVLARISQVG